MLFKLFLLLFKVLMLFKDFDFNEVVLIKRNCKKLKKKGCKRNKKKNRKLKKLKKDVTKKLDFIFLLLLLFLRI